MGQSLVCIGVVIGIAAALIDIYQFISGNTSLRRHRTDHWGGDYQRDRYQGKRFYHDKPVHDRRSYLGCTIIFFITLAAFYGVYIYYFSDLDMDIQPWVIYAVPLFVASAVGFLFFNIFNRRKN